MKYDFAIRTDLGYNIGSGHFIRCLSLAKQLIKNNFKILFIISNSNPINILNKSNIPYQILNETYIQNQIFECKQVCKSCKKLIIDLQLDNEKYDAQLVKTIDTIVIDDLGNKKIFSKILFNGSIVKKYHQYRIINKNYTQLYLGPKYMILGKLFSTRKKLVKISKSIKKLLITFGGSDDYNITKQIIPYFFDKQVDVTVILGSEFKNKDEFRKLVQNHTNVKIKTNVNDISRLVINQDVVIASSGVTAYELACLGIPTIFIPVDNMQLLTAKMMESEGFGINYGYWNDDFTKLTNALNRIKSFNIRKQMNQAGSTLVDGKGVIRAANILSRLIDN